MQFHVVPDLTRKPRFPARTSVKRMVPTKSDDQVEFEARPCPICKGVDRQHLVRDANIDFERLNAASFSSRKLPEYLHYRLVKCDLCSLVYANPAPTPAFLATSYRDATFDATRQSEY